jgi:hypothetical protein
MKKSEFVKAVQEVLQEMSMTGAVGGYLTPKAFAKKGQGKNAATKESERLGMKTVPVKKYPYSTKMIDYKKFQ